jgi:putative N6-adenine-specific DNA methylase
MEKNTQKTDQNFIAKTFEGLEEVLARELAAIGAKNIRLLRRGIWFSGDTALMYRANYLCRTALRILKPIAEFPVTDEQSLYEGVQQINWDLYLDNKMTFAINCITSHKVLSHSQYASLKAKDAIVDLFRKRTGLRPSVNTEKPDLRINVHLSKDKCTISLDSSGSSLHLRGYRVAGGLAPLNEVLAAGMIQLSDWSGKSDFTDPMCGSGTLLIEAALYALNIPAGYYRQSYGFEKWKDFQPGLFQEIKIEAGLKEKDFKYQIRGYDSSPRAIISSRQNIGSARLRDHIKIIESSLEEIEEQINPGILISNPPYGERIKVDDAIQLYKSIGDKLKHAFEGFDAWIISADLDSLKHVGLKSSRKIKLYNGKLECRLLEYALYSGSKKIKK